MEEELIEKDQEEEVGAEEAKVNLNTAAAADLEAAGISPGIAGWGSEQARPPIHLLPRHPPANKEMRR